MMADWRVTAARNERNGIVRRVEIANPCERTWQRQSFVFWFGACGPTYVLAYGRGIEDALESAAGWLADHAPGLIMPPDSDELYDLELEAQRETCGVELPTYWERSPAVERCIARAQEVAVADLTYTESGYLTSYEWGIALENPTPAELLDFVKGGK